jgi:hypothetical protein
MPDILLLAWMLLGFAVYLPGMRFPEWTAWWCARFGDRAMLVAFFVWLAVSAALLALVISSPAS